MGCPFQDKLLSDSGQIPNRPWGNPETYQYLGVDLPGPVTSARTQALSKEASSWFLMFSSFMLNIGSLGVSFSLSRVLLVPKKKNHFYSNQKKSSFK